MLCHKRQPMIRENCFKSLNFCLDTPKAHINHALTIETHQKASLFCFIVKVKKRYTPYAHWPQKVIHRGNKNQIIQI